MTESDTTTSLESSQDASAADATSDSSIARLQARIETLEKKLDGAGSAVGAETKAPPTGLSLFTKVLLAVAVPLVPAIFGFSQFLIQREADELALALAQQKYEHEVIKYQNKQLEDAIARFLVAESYAQRVRILDALNGLVPSVRWFHLMTALREIVVREGQTLAENGELNEVEADAVDQVMAQTQAHLVEAQALLPKPDAAGPKSGDARSASYPTPTTAPPPVYTMPPTPTKPGKTIRSRVRKQYVRIGLTNNCDEAKAAAKTLRAKRRQYLFEVWLQKDGRCALTVGSYSLSGAKKAAEQWKAMGLRNYEHALVTSESHFDKRVFPP